MKDLICCPHPEIKVDHEKKIWWCETCMSHGTLVVKTITLRCAALHMEELKRQFKKAIVKDIDTLMKVVKPFSKWVDIKIKGGVI